MLKEQLYNVLINIGIEESQAKIYLALSEIGHGSILEIARKSGLNRASIYYTIEKMRKLGFVEVIQTNTNSLVFIPVKPEIILNKHKTHLEEFKTVIPEINSLITF